MTMTFFLLSDIACTSFSFSIKLFSFETIGLDISARLEIWLKTIS